MTTTLFRQAIAPYKESWYARWSLISEYPTLKDFLNYCDNGDVILWLFKQLNPDKKKELTHAKLQIIGHSYEDNPITCELLDSAKKYLEGEIDENQLKELLRIWVNKKTGDGNMCLSDRDTYVYSAVSTDSCGLVPTPYIHSYNHTEENVAKALQQGAVECRALLPLEFWRQDLANEISEPPFRNIKVKIDNPNEYISPYDLRIISLTAAYVLLEDGSIWRWTTEGENLRFVFRERIKNPYPNHISTTNNNKK